MIRAVSRLCLLVVAAAWAPAQHTSTVPVTVTAVGGRSVYLDRGREHGLAPGSLVRLFPSGIGQLEVEVRAVSASSARAELRPGQTAPPVGTRGEFEPAAPPPSVAPASDPSRPAPVEHPPWTRQEPARTAGQPLLVPAYRQRPGDRPSDVHGRLFVQTDWNVDQSGEADGEYWLARTGTRLEGSNMLGLGERLRFAGELSLRRLTTDDAPEGDDRTGRIDQLSVALGTEEWAPYGIEAGRFLSEHVPELGLVDGLEGVTRFRGGVRVGAGLGFYPRPFPARDLGEDAGAHVFADFVADAERSFAAGVAFQKSWHEGAPDRDLFLLRGEMRRGLLSLYATAKVDLYTAGDARKDSGLELTEFLGQARLDGAGAGVGLQASRFRWPDLKRREFNDLPDDLVRNGELDRLSLSGWVRPAPVLRLSARADAWRDQAGDGTAWELAGDWSEVLGTDSALHAALFHADGGSTSGPGVRLRARRRLWGIDASLGYRWHSYDHDDLLDGAETLTRQSLALGLDWSFHAIDWSLTAERWFGDREDAYAVSLFAQVRF